MSGWMECRGLSRHFRSIEATRPLCYPKTKKIEDTEALSPEKFFTALQSNVLLPGSGPGGKILLNALEATFNYLPCTESSMPEGKILGRLFWLKSKGQMIWKIKVVVDITCAVGISLSVGHVGTHAKSAVGILILLVKWPCLGRDI